MARDLDNVECYDVCEPDNDDLVKAVTMMDNCYGDTIGEWLDPKLVREGCIDEMRRLSEMQVYKRVLREEALRDPEMKLIGV